jgi:hypothetical protein
MGQKVKKQRFLKYLFMVFTHTKKVNIGPFIKAGIRIWSQTSGSGSDHKGTDPTISGSGSATLVFKAN